jgi:hypothetical protein
MFVYKILQNAPEVTEGMNDGEDVDDEEDDEDDDEEEELEESDVKNRRRSINKECNKPQRVASKSHKWIEMRPRTLGTLKQKILNYLHQCDDALNKMEVEVTNLLVLILFIRVLISFLLTWLMYHNFSLTSRFFAPLIFHFIINFTDCYRIILIDCFVLRLPNLHSFPYLSLTIMLHFILQ